MPIAVAVIVPLLSKYKIHHHECQQKEMKCNKKSIPQIMQSEIEHSFTNAKNEKLHKTNLQDGKRLNILYVWYNQTIWSSHGDSDIVGTYKIQ